MLGQQRLRFERLGLVLPKADVASDDLLSGRIPKSMFQLLFCDFSFQISFQSALHFAILFIYLNPPPGVEVESNKNVLVYERTNKADMKHAIREQKHESRARAIGV